MINFGSVFEDCWHSILSFDSASAGKFNTREHIIEKRTILKQYILLLITHTIELVPLVLFSRSCQRRLSCSALKKVTERHFRQNQFWDPPDRKDFTIWNTYVLMKESVLKHISHIKWQNSDMSFLYCNILILRSQCRNVF